MVYGLLVGPLLVKDVTSLPTNLRNADAWSVVESSSVKVQLKSKQLPRQQLLQIPAPSAASGLQPEVSPRGQATSGEVHHAGGALGSREIASQPMVLHRSRLLKLESYLSAGTTVALTFFAVLLLTLLWLVCFADDDSISLMMTPKTPLTGSAYDSQRVEETATMKVKESRKSSKEEIQGSKKKLSAEEEKASRKASKEGVSVVVHSANTRDNLLKIEATQSAGTWAETYRNADNKSSKEALEMMFRCNIIPVQEFAHSYVSQEHIGECVWISTQMLRQRSVEDWVEDWPQAMKTFEESVTACFAARTDAVANLYGSPMPGSTSPSTANVSPDAPSDRGLMDCRTSPFSPDALGPSPVPKLRPICSIPSTSNALTEDQIPSHAPDLRNAFYHSNVSSGKNLSETPPIVPGSQTSVRSSSFPVVRPRTPGIPEPIPVRPELSPDVRSSVIARCREIMRDTPTHASSVINPVLHLEQGRSHSQPVYASAPAAYFRAPAGEDIAAPVPSASAVSKFALPPLGGRMDGDKHLSESYGSLVPMGSDKSLGSGREVRDDADAASG